MRAFRPGMNYVPQMYPISGDIFAVEVCEFCRYLLGVFRAVSFDEICRRASGRRAYNRRRRSERARRICAILER